MKEPRPVISRSVLDLAREVGDGELPPGADRRARERFEQAAFGRRRSLPRALPAWLPRGFAPALAALALVLVLLAGGVSMRLRFAVDGAALGEGNFVRASDAEPAAITFSDGTRVDVDPRATVRVAGAGLRGADLVQERGRATYAVVHRPVAAWTVEAGPFRVLVTGTRFSVAWSPDTSTFVAELYEGSVTIDGPSAGSGVRLRAGQRLRASVPGSLVVEEMTGADPASAAATTKLSPRRAGAGAGDTPGDTPRPISTEPAAPSSASPVAPSASPGDEATGGAASPSNGEPAPNGDPASPAASTSASASSAAAPPRSLAERLAQGESAAIAAELEQEGVASFAARSSAADLAIAADAARYANKSALANAALTTLRARHPGTREASLAAFHLGRAAESASPSVAASWYDTYLAETGGGGALAVEARGRKMSIVARTAGNAAARPLAEAYLAASPKGPHAALARSIVASP